MNPYEVVGVDLSLTSTGVAQVNPNGVIDTWLVKSKAPTSGSETLLSRLDRHMGIVSKITDGFSNNHNKFIALEGPALNSRHGKQWDRAGLWWSLVDTLVFAGYHVVEIPPNNRAKYATGKARVDKDVVLASAIKRYPEADITNNNIADAVILAAMAARHLGFPLEDSLPQTHVDALNGVHWNKGAKRG